MKRLFLLIGMIFCFTITQALSAIYMELTPGQSSKSDVDRVFGKPVKEIVKNSQYDYAPGPHDASRVSVVFEGPGQTLREIQLYFQKRYARQQFLEWFDLGEPTHESWDRSGNRVEHFGNEGIVLYFNSSDRSGDIVSLSYIAAHLPGGGGVQRSAAFVEQSEERVLFTRGMELFEEKKYAEAAEVFLQFVQTKPRESFEMLGLCFLKLNRNREAESYLRKSYKLDTRAPYTVYHLGLVYEQLGQKDKARTFFQRYVNLGHNNAFMNEYARGRIEIYKNETLRNLGKDLYKIYEGWQMP